jgi:hypothetical protein
MILKSIKQPTRYMRSFLPAVCIAAPKSLTNLSF